MSEEECIFCRIISREEPADIFLESDEYISFDNSYSRHYHDKIIIPKKDIKDIEKIINSESYFRFVQDVEDKIKEIYDAENTEINIYNSEQLNHIYIQIIPHYI